MLLQLVLVAVCRTAIAEMCGGVLTEPNGVIQTPGFPGPLQVPVRCHWLIDSSELPEPDVQIVVYLTQLYVTSGLTFTEYDFFDPYDISLQKNPSLLFSVSEQNSVTVRWLATRSRFLVIKLELDHLEGNHLRVLDHLLDVFGFNITYQMVNTSVRNDSCSVIDCSFAGNCYVTPDYNEFWCSCFPEYWGPSCNYGPICQPDSNPCLNGGECRHAGKYSTCTCLQGYTGSRCEVALLDSGCSNEDSDCSNQCRIDAKVGPTCKCPEALRIEADRWRYVLTINLCNVTSLVVQHPGKTLSNYLEKQIQRFFRSLSLLRLEDIQVLNISNNGQVYFHFFADEHDLSKVQKGLKRMVERGKIGELLVHGSNTNLHYEQGLRLEDFHVRNADILENEQVILSCSAQGSEQIEFSWFKDGYPIDSSKSLGGLWMRILPKNSRNEYTAFLGIDSVQAVDNGMYTCHVADWGIQECKSVYIEVQGSPIIQVSPMAASLKKGDSIDLTCVSTDQGVSYSWTRNKNLFVLNTSSEVWEDLKPWGSILRIRNFQKSVTYTCHAHTRVAKTEKSIRIDLLSSGSCQEIEEEGILWKATAAGSVAMADCPPKYVGYSTRYCVTIKTEEATWEKPDFSNCISESLDQIINDLQRIFRGHSKSTLKHVLSELYSWLRSRSPCHRGEGEPILNLLSQVAEFVDRTFSSEEVNNITKVFYANVDLLLSQPNSFIQIKKVGELQELVDRWSLMWGRHFSPAMEHLSYNEVFIDVIKVKSQVQYHYNIPLSSNYPRWYTAKVQIDVMAKAGKHINEITVINYKNISKFLPEISFQMLKDGKELLYKVRSNVLSVSAGGEMDIHLEMTQSVAGVIGENWNLACARADVISKEWNISSCLLVSQTRNSCRCICHQTGLFAALLIKQPEDKLPLVARELSSPVIALGCGCCLLQSCLTLLLLSCRKAFVQLLKIQFCLAVSAIMFIFIYLTRVQPSENVYQCLAILLQLLFFLALSSLLGNQLIIYTEVVYLPYFKSAKQSVMGLTTGITVLQWLISLIMESFSKIKPKSSWWLPLGSAPFYIMIISTLLMICLFVIVSIGLFRSLHHLRAMKSGKSKYVIDRRLVLVKRTSILFSVTVLLVLSSIFFINGPNTISLYTFSSLCAILGFLIFLFYVLLSESSLKIKLMKKLKISANEQDYCSDSDHNLFNVFTKHEQETESEGVLPLAMEESMIPLQEIPQQNAPKSKTVTFSDQPHYDRNVKHVDLEVYLNSPKKISNSSDEVLASVPNIDTVDITHQQVTHKGKTFKEAERIELSEVKVPPEKSLSAESLSEVINQISYDLEYILEGTSSWLESTSHTRHSSINSSPSSSAHIAKTNL